MICLQAFQRRVDGLQNSGLRKPLFIGSVAHLAPGFRRQYNLIAILFKPFAGNLLRLPAVINIRGIDEIDALVDTVVEGPVRSSLVHLRPEGHGAKAYAGYIEISAAK